MFYYYSFNNIIYSNWTIFLIKGPKNKEEEKEDEEEKEEEDDPNKFYKISSLFFNSLKKEITRTKINLNLYNNERLIEKENVKEINSEYLFTIVSEPNLENEYFIGYVIILSRIEFLNKNQKTFFNDSNIINEDNKNYKGIIKVKFKNDGTIIDRLFQSDLSVTYMDEINDIISCVIPDFIKKRNLQKINEDNYLFNYETSYNSGEDKNENIFWFSKIIDELNSENYIKINITIQNNHIKQSVLEKNIDL